MGIFNRLVKVEFNCPLGWWQIGVVVRTVLAIDNELLKATYIQCFTTGRKMSHTAGAIGALWLVVGVSIELIGVIGEVY